MTCCGSRFCTSLLHLSQQRCGVTAAPCSSQPQVLQQADCRSTPHSGQYKNGFPVFSPSDSVRFAPCSAAWRRSAEPTTLAEPLETQAFSGKPGMSKKVRPTLGGGLSTL